MVEFDPAFRLLIIQVDAPTAQSIAANACKREHLTVFTAKSVRNCPSQRQVALLEATESLRRGEKFSKSSVTLCLSGKRICVRWS